MQMLETLSSLNEDTRKRDKRSLILNGAIETFAKKGYQYATIEEIAREAGVSKGLVHFYFENKLDVLFSVILLFSDGINESITRKLSSLHDPVTKLHAVFETFQEMMINKKKNISWGNILKEGLPGTAALKNRKLKEKYRQIIQTAEYLQNTIDGIILEGQQKGLIDPSLKPAVIRQILGGSSQMLFYGLTLQRRRGRNFGYSEEDVVASLHVLIDKFILHQ